MLFQTRTIAGISLLCSLGALLPAFSASTVTKPAASSTTQTAPKTTKPATDKGWWPASLEGVLVRAGANRAEIGKALRQVPVAQRAGMLFLVQNMPDSDLKSLKATYLLENVALGYEAWQKAPWKAQVPEAVFFNEVLPYATLNEERDDVRASLRAKSLPLIADCKTLDEAAMRINAKLFPLVKVIYSTERNRPDQNATETMASGKASCSGLSILLVGALRSVGIPARIAGTPMWANGRGNHTWVEVWDGQWKFMGAAEPDAQGLNHGWFAHDASEARADKPINGIYATSWKKTGTSFPLVWAEKNTSVNAENVTLRYAPDQTRLAAADTTTTRLLISFTDQNKKRVAVHVSVQDADGKVLGDGTTKDETADTNDFLAFNVPQNTPLKLIIEMNGQKAELPFKSNDQPQMLISLSVKAAVPDPPIARLNLPPAYVPPAIVALDAASETAAKNAFAEYFALAPEKRATYKFPAALEAKLSANEAALRQLAWEAYKATPHTFLKADYDAQQVQFDKYLSPFTIKTVGTRPKHGWPLFIAMHGGGAGPKSLNDEQWEEMQKYYRDHPEVGGYKYLALRAPNDTWNGFYDDYVYPLIGNLIRAQLVYGDVDPNSVFIMGYSHGGYGAYAIGPKMPDHFAFIHASASAATDGETSAKTLRNTPFTAMVGDQDTMFGRLERNQKFDALIKTLRGDRTDIFPVRIDIMKGYQHSNLPDRDMIPAMYGAVRNPVPRELTWEQTDTVIHDFFWLYTQAPAKNREIDATCRDNTITVTTTGEVSKAYALLDSRLVDESKPLSLEVNGKKSQVTLKPSLKTLCDTMERRGDPELAFTIEVPLVP